MPEFSLKGTGLVSGESRDIKHISSASFQAQFIITGLLLKFYSGPEHT